MICDKAESLKQKGLPVTVQRIAILEYMDGNMDHPSADDIHAALHKKYSSISRATVYNNLETLVDSGLLQEIDIDPEKAHYDCNAQAHHHFYCTSCKQLYDVEIACPQLSHRDINGHRIEQVQGYFLGTCKSCLTKA